MIKAYLRPKQTCEAIQFNRSLSVPNVMALLDEGYISVSIHVYEDDTCHMQIRTNDNTIITVLEHDWIIRKNSDHTNEFLTNEKFKSEWEER